MGNTANIRHAICFSRRSVCNRILVVGVGIPISASTMAVGAISIVVKVGVVGSGSGFCGSKCNILVEPLRTPTPDHCGDNKDQYSDSDESYHTECASNSCSVLEETLVGIGGHDPSGRRGRSNDGGDDYSVTI